jgi:non-canonical purine NTP pyrophosphatase (RdgB/HAM1 family)
MKEFIFISGNQHKADYLAKWLGQPIAHQKVDLPELQSLDAQEIITAKAQAAYEIIKKPVLVEDVSLTFTAMGRLPGPFIKWFLEEIGPAGLVKIADSLPHRQAVAGILFTYYDGKDMRLFEATTEGTVSDEPRGLNAFGAKGWNPIFIPKGSTKTFAEMTDDEVRPFSQRAKAIEKLRLFLEEG